MYNIELDNVQCNKCGSGSYESVIYGLETFIRCLQCGHEGTKTPLCPELRTSHRGAPSFIKKDTDIREL